MVEELYESILAAKANTDELSKEPPSRLDSSHWIPYLVASEELRSCKEGIGAVMIQFTKLTSVFQNSVSKLPEFATQDLLIETGQDPVSLIDPHLIYCN